MSDWKEGALKRRDARHTKVSDEPTKSVKVAKKKDTKKWCRGKEGVEHKLECVPYSATKKTTQKFYESWRLLICKTCGKEMDTYFPSLGKFIRRQKPAWVDK